MTKPPDDPRELARTVTDNGSVTLLGVSASQVTAADFEFV